jgi:hypothetical protein
MQWCVTLNNSGRLMRGTWSQARLRLTYTPREEGGR